MQQPFFYFGLFYKFEHIFSSISQMVGEISLHL